MKNTHIATLLFTGLLCLNSCKDKENPTQPQVVDVNTTEQASLGGEPAIATAPKTYTVVATPEAVFLGKNKEAAVRILNLKAVELSDPDGKALGVEFSYDIELTNKNSVSNSNQIQIDPEKFRLVLDNGNKITHDSYNSVTTNSDETKSSIANVFKLPAGTKPVSLNLFYDDTIVTVKIEMK